MMMNASAKWVRRNEKPNSAYHWYVLRIPVTISTRDDATKIAMDARSRK
jgi:hypothetical protein